jgi:hypothetical protein
MEVAVDDYHRKLREIWIRYEGSNVAGFENVPHFGQPVDWHPRVKVLFLGLNPSFVPGTLRSHWATVHANNPRLNAMGMTALEWSAMRPIHRWNRLRPAVTQLDHHSRANYPRYYAPLEAFAQAAGVTGGLIHLDLFPLRNTSQKALEKHLPTPESGNRNWHPALMELFEATLKLVQNMKPEVVVVANALASDLLEYRLPLIVQRNRHRFESPALPGSVFLLGSQLSGGATSKYAGMRLLADLRDALRGRSGLNGRP